MHCGSWIASEREFFGQPHTDYDFRVRDPKRAKERMASLLASRDKLAKKINKKVMGMIEKAEEEYTALMNKRRIIEADRRTIERVLAACMSLDAEARAHREEQQEKQEAALEQHSKRKKKKKAKGKKR